MATIKSLNLYNNNEKTTRTNEGGEFTLYTIKSFKIYFEFSFGAKIDAVFCLRDTILLSLQVLFLFWENTIIAFGGFTFANTSR